MSIIRKALATYDGLGSGLLARLTEDERHELADYIASELAFHFEAEAEKVKTILDGKAAVANGVIRREYLEIAKELRATDAGVRS